MKFFKEIKQPVAEATRPDAYQRDEINATSGFGKNSYAYQMDGGANDEDHEGDRRREQQVQSGTWYVRINGKIVKDKAGNAYTFRGKAAANKAALTMQAKPFNQGKQFMLTTNPNDKVEEGADSDGYYCEKVAQEIFDKRQDITSEEEVLNQAYHIVANELGQKAARYKFNYDEDFPSDVVSNYFHLQKQGVTENTLSESDSPVAGAITRRILLQRSDLLQKYGPVKVMAAIDEVADFVGDTEEIGSSDVSGWIKHVEQMLGNMGEGIEEDTLSQMRDYFSSDDGSVDVSREYGEPERKNPTVGIPPHIQALVNKMYTAKKITPQEFQVLQNFQKKTKINVGIKEADMSTGNAGYDSMLAVMKAVDAGHDATFNLGGEPVTLEYPEARFLAGRYKAFLKAGRQEEFLKYMESPVAFDRLMKQLRDLMDKQKNFKGSVEGERGIEEASQQVDSLVTDALKIMRGAEVSDAIQALKTVLGDREFSGRRGHYNFYVRQLMDMYGQKQGTTESVQSLPEVNENEYWCQIDSMSKPIPEGYKRTANGYITRA